MKIVLGFLFSAVGLLVLAGFVLYLVGRAQPEGHTSSVSFILLRPRAVVWAALTDNASVPQWWPAVKSIRFETTANAEVITWNTDAHGKEIGFRTKEEKSTTRLVREIVGKDLPFGGTWTYELVDEDGSSTRLTLIEDGIIRPPLFRAVARYFIGLDATMKDFQKHFSAYIITK